MTRRRGRAAVAAALLPLLGPPATAASMVPLFSRPPLNDPMRLTQGTKAPPGDSDTAPATRAPPGDAGSAPAAKAPPSDVDAAPPPDALPPRANFGAVPTRADSAPLNFQNAPLSSRAAPVVVPQGSAAAPGDAPVMTPGGALSGGVRPGAAPVGAAERSDSTAANPGPPDALPLGASFPMVAVTFTSAEMRFSDAHVAAASSPFAAPGAAVAALPGGMAMREEGRGLRVTLDADVLFDFDRAELRPDAGPRLRRLMDEASVRIPRPAFRVEGHTDWIGSDAYNLRLSARRAEAVRSWLVQAAGVPRPAASTIGYGESRPVAPNATPDGRDDPDGRQRNRRVELLATPR